MDLKHGALLDLHFHSREQRNYTMKVMLFRGWVVYYSFGIFCLKTFAFKHLQLPHKLIKPHSFYEAEKKKLKALPSHFSPSDSFVQTYE